MTNTLTGRTAFSRAVDAYTDALVAGADTCEYYKQPALFPAPTAPRHAKALRSTSLALAARIAAGYRPRVLVLFCSAGGDSMGWHRAGFDVTGVDIEEQPRYPFKFIKADAFKYFAEHGHEYDFVAAGPMCRDHTWLTSVAGVTGTGWQLAATEKMLAESGMPYVLENVMGSALKADIVLCGKMFGLRVKRHRKFKSNIPLTAPGHPDACRTVPTATKKRRERWDQGWDLSVTGDIGTYYGPEGMGIDWMNGNELSQAIPPAYTEWIGRQVMAYLSTDHAVTL